MRKPTKPPPMHTRITQAWYEHPLAVLGGIASAVGIMAAIGPVILFAIHYFASADDLATHKVNDARANAWTTVQLVKNETIALRNRVNDCDIAGEKNKTMSPLERQACKQYQQEFDDATRRFNEARSAAMATTKEK